MTTAAPAVRFPDARLAAVAAAACGLGASAALTGSASLSLPLLFAGGALLAAGAILVLAGQWLPPLVVLAAVLPLPPLFSTELVRLSPAFAMTVLLALAWGLRNAADGGRAPALPAAFPRRSAMLLLAAVLAAAAFGAQPESAMRETVNWVLALALLVIATRQLTASPQLARSLALAVAATAAVAGVLAVWQSLGLLPGQFPISGSAFYRASLGFGWPNELGVFLALSLPFAVYAIETAPSRSARIAGAAGALALGLGLLATFSRGSWLAVLLAPAVLLAGGGGRVAVRVWCCALLIALLGDVLTGGALRARIGMTVGDWVIEQRAALTLAGLLMVAAHPLLGVGPGGFAASLEQYGPQIGWLWDYLPTAQNGYVQMAAETGLIGLAALLLFFAAVFRSLLRGARAARHSPAGPLSRAALWSFATALLLAGNEWVFAHGLVQLVMLTASLGITASIRAPERP